MLPRTVMMGLLVVATVDTVHGVHTVPAVGDVWLNASLSNFSFTHGGVVEVTIDTTPNGTEVWWELGPLRLRLLRREGREVVALKDTPYGKVLPDKLVSVSVLRRGSYYFLYADGSIMLDFALHPISEIFCRKGSVGMPEEATVEMEVRTLPPASVQYRVTAVEYEDLPLPSTPIAGRGAEGTWDSRQRIPGAALTIGTWHYVFFCGADYKDPAVEAGGVVRTGIMRSQDLVKWEVRADPILEGTKGEWDEDNVCVNGAVVNPNGSVAVTYTGCGSYLWGVSCRYRYPSEHNGTGKATDALGVAVAENIWDGPYTKHRTPVLSRGASGDWDGSAIHEHDLVLLDNGTYLVFYTGCCASDCPGGWCDQGGLATSQDMVTFTKYPGNPVLKWNRDRQAWDAKHRRPRSLTSISGMWYLLYEGAAYDNDMIANCTRDAIGAARSKDLVNWETHPLQVAIPWQTGSLFDSMWTGWPRALVAPPKVHVFYAAGGPSFLNTSRRWATTGLRTWSVDNFVAWSE